MIITVTYTTVVTKKMEVSDEYKPLLDEDFLFDPKFTSMVDKMENDIINALADVENIYGIENVYDESGDFLIYEN